jgi:hypothetical protein
MSYVVTVGSSDMSQHVNHAIDIFLDGMEKDGVITEKQHGEMLRYRIVVHEPGFWGGLWKKLFKTSKNDQWLYSAVRMTSSITEIDEYKDVGGEKEKEK